MRRLHVIGTTQVWIDGVETTLRGRERALLAALAIDHPVAVRRDVLIDRLWPGDAPANARKSLHNHVSRLRRSLGTAFIETAHEGYRLADDVTIDAVELTTTESGAPGGTVGAPSLPSGMPYADLDAGGRGVTRARRRIVATRTALRLEFAASDTESAIELLETAVEDDPYAERVWVALAEGYARAGRRREAAQTFTRARNTLVRAGLAAGATLDDAERAVLSDTPRTADGRLVATAEMIEARSQHRHRDEIVDVVLGGPGVVLLHGPAGIGKTTTLDLVGPKLASKGVHVVVTRCEAEPLLPLEPIALVVENLLDRLPAIVAELDDPSPLALLSPAIASVVGSGTTMVDPERRRLEGAIVELLTHPRLQPLAVLIDDLHWSTQATRTLLGAAVDRAQSDGLDIAVVATWRGSQPGPVIGGTPPVPIAVTGFAPDEIERTVVALVDTPSERRVLAESLHDATDGNPLFVRELVRTLARHRGHGHTADPMAIEPIPDSVTTLLDSRIAQLDGPSAEVAAAAAILGRRQLMSDVAALAPGGDIGDCMSTGVLRAVDEHTTEFEHELLRRAVLDTLGPARRVELHDAAAHIIGSSSRADERVTEVAHHAIEAGALDPLGAAHHARNAARVLRRQANHTEAADLLARAAQVLETSGRWPARRLELLIEQGAARLRVGDPRAQPTLEAALELARRLDDHELHARATIELCRLGPTTESGINDRVATEAIECSLANVTDAGTRARVAAAATMVYSMAGETQRCRDLLDVALVDAAKDGRPEVLADVLPFTYMTISEPQDLPRRQAIADELAEIGRSLRRPDVEWEALQIHFSNALQCGDPSLRHDLERMERLASEIRERPRDWEMHYLRATVAQLDGNLAHSEQIITDSLGFADCVAPSRVMAVYGAHLLAIRTLEDRAGELLEELITLNREQPTVGAWQAGLAMVAAEAGDHDLATTAFDTATADGLQMLDRDFSYTGALFCLGRAAVLLDDPRRSLIAYEAVAAHVDRWSWVGTTTLGPLAEPAAACLRVLGREDEADSLAKKAITAADGLAAPIHAARLRRDRPVGV